eukprot:scaffold312846_cov30-Tisochrysis_lutea.AAC.4
MAACASPLCVASVSARTACSASSRILWTREAISEDGRVPSVASLAGSSNGAKLRPPEATQPHVTPRSRCSLCTTDVRPVSARPDI